MINKSTVNIAQFYQTGIGLPERDYYFKTDSSTLNIQKAYKKYLSTLFELTELMQLPQRKMQQLPMRLKNNWQQHTERISNSGT